MDMRTAEDILTSHYFRRGDPETDIDELITIINEARIEAIKGCAEVAKEGELLLRRAYNHNREDMGWDVDYQEYIDKNPILKLIEQVK